MNTKPTFKIVRVSLVNVGLQIATCIYYALSIIENNVFENVDQKTVHTHLSVSNFYCKITVSLAFWSRHIQVLFWKLYNKKWVISVNERSTLYLRSFASAIKMFGNFKNVGFELRAGITYFYPLILHCVGNIFIFLLGKGNKSE